MQLFQSIISLWSISVRPERHLSLFFSGRVQQRDCVMFALTKKMITI